MKLFALSLLLIGAALSAEPTAPKPIPAERQEALSRLLIQLQASELQIATIRMKMPELGAAEMRSAQFERALGHAIDTLIRDGYAPACEEGEKPRLSMEDKTWKCQKEPAK